MPRKRKITSDRKVTPHVPLDRDWIVRTEITVNGRHVGTDTEVKIEGQGGIRWAFKRHVVNPANGAEWIDVFGGSKGSECLRSFRTEKITTVHRLTKRRPAKGSS